MPKGRYTIGARGTHGCSGYPVVGDTGKVHGCHKTRAAARAQQAAIYTSTASKSLDEYYSEDTAIRKNGCCPEVEKAQGPCWEGYEMVGWKTEGGKKVPNCVPKNTTNKSMTISQNVSGCNGYAIVNEDGEVKGCYATRQEAEAAVLNHESPESEMSRPGHDEMSKSFWRGIFK